MKHHVSPWLLVLACLIGGGAHAEEPEAQSSDWTLRLKGIHIPVDLAAIREELRAEVATFEETGIVSIEAGAACLDASAGEGQSGPGDTVTPPQIERVPAVLRVQIKIPSPQPPR